MSEFYLESQSLNLNKQVFNFEYDPIKEVQGDLDTFWQNRLDAQDDLSTGLKSNHIYLQEKKMILNDVKNLLGVFYQKNILGREDPELRDFPFKTLTNRLCALFYKYMEQSVVLDQIMEAVVVNIMHLVKTFVDLKLQQYVKDPQAFLKTAGDKFRAYDEHVTQGSLCATVFT